MKLVKMKDAIEILNKLKDGYENLKLLIADQIRDNQLTEAKENFEKLKSLGQEIEKIENMDVQV